MEYLKIVLEGYFNPNTRDSLSNYFFREFKKAEKEHYDIDEFFKGCLGIVNAFKQNLLHRLSKRKSELYLMKRLAEAGELSYPEKDPNLSIEQRRENSIKYANEELESIMIDDFYLNLGSITKGLYIGQMSNSQIIFISDEINKAYLKALNELRETQKSKKSFDKIGQTETNKTLNGFKDIFYNDGWEKYIDAMVKVSPPLLDNNWKFIGKPRGDKGVVCSWIKTLQDKGIVKQYINRSQLATVLNTEIKSFNVGSDGKTFNNISKKYDQYENELKKLTGLLPLVT